MNRYAMLGVTMLVGACGQDGTSDPGTQQTGLHIGSHTATAVEGTFDDGVAHIAFSARETASNVVTVEIVTDTHRFDVDVDYNTGVVRATGDAVAFTQEEIDAFSALDAELAFMSTEHMTPVERIVTGWASLMTEAVPGMVWQNVQTTATRGWVDIGPNNTCRTLYGSCGNPYKMTGKNSPNCKGRCGAGCGSARSGGNNHWTMDCAEHDYTIGPFGDCVDDATLSANVYSSGSGEFCASNCNRCGDGC